MFSYEETLEREERPETERADDRLAESGVARRFGEEEGDGVVRFAGEEPTCVDMLEQQG